MNGLLGFYLLGALMCCMQLSFSVYDTFHAIPLLLYALLTILFLLVNYPWGKLFMGDAGAYLMALLIGIWVIDFFGTYEFISSWNAGLIFFYPIAEVNYSVIRKLLQKKSPFQPDREHLHLKVFDILNTAMNKPRLSNNLTTVFLAIFWLSPPLILPWIYDSQTMICLSILILSLVYLILNKVIPSRTKY
jgi:UDP-N-acetylmuramyl pentapeptide phosphotransferase/UDP-N-acetylglucosamine-1-phosphate transferase